MSNFILPNLNDYILIRWTNDPTDLTAYIGRVTEALKIKFTVTWYDNTEIPIDKWTTFSYYIIPSSNTLLDDSAQSPAKKKLEYPNEADVNTYLRRYFISPIRGPIKSVDNLQNAIAAAAAASPDTSSRRVKRAKGKVIFEQIEDDMGDDKYNKIRRECDQPKFGSSYRNIDFNMELLNKYKINKDKTISININNIPEVINTEKYIDKNKHIRLTDAFHDAANRPGLTDDIIAGALSIPLRERTKYNDEKNSIKLLFGDRFVQFITQEDHVDIDIPALYTNASSIISNIEAFKRDIMDKIDRVKNSANNQYIKINLGHPNKVYDDGGTRPNSGFYHLGNDIIKKNILKDFIQTYLNIDPTNNIIDNANSLENTLYDNFMTVANLYDLERSFDIPDKPIYILRYPYSINQDNGELSYFNKIAIEQDKIILEKNDQNKIKCNYVDLKTNEYELPEEIQNPRNPRQLFSFLPRNNPPTHINTIDKYKDFCDTIIQESFGYKITERKISILTDLKSAGDFLTVKACQYFDKILLTSDKIAVCKGIIDGCNIIYVYEEQITRNRYIHIIKGMHSQSSAAPGPAAPPPAPPPAPAPVAPPGFAAPALSVDYIRTKLWQFREYILGITINPGCSDTFKSFHFIIQNILISKLMNIAEKLTRIEWSSDQSLMSLLNSQIDYLSIDFRVYKQFYIDACNTSLSDIHREEIFAGLTNLFEIESIQAYIAARYSIQNGHEPATNPIEVAITSALTELNFTETNISTYIRALTHAIERLPESLKNYIITAPPRTGGGKGNNFSKTNKTMNDKMIFIDIITSIISLLCTFPNNTVLYSFMNNFWQNVFKESSTNSQPNYKLFYQIYKTRVPLIRKYMHNYILQKYKLKNMTEYAYVMFGYNRILDYYKDYLIIKTKQNKLKNTKLKNSKVTKCKNKLECLTNNYKPPLITAGNKNTKTKSKNTKITKNEQS